MATSGCAGDEKTGCDWASALAFAAMRILNAPMSFVCLVSTFLVIMAVLNGFAKPAERPNFVLILCDDMGRSDIGCYGARSTRRTSTDLQRGMRFTQF